MSRDLTFIICGATGNLSQVKLMPALYHLELAGKLPDGMRILAAPLKGDKAIVSGESGVQHSAAWQISFTATI